MTADAAIACNRFGLGARPGELAKIRDARGWLRAQLTGSGKLPDEVLALGNTTDVVNQVAALRRERRQMRVAGKPNSKDYPRTVRAHYMAQVLARYQLAASTDTPLNERLVHFFANHFAVSTDKQPLPAIAGLFEHEAIRPHVNGRFEDMLIAVAQHPAMLLYLDNQASMGPNSRAGKNAAKRAPERNAGLNENLAREILELHTLGVDGGYTQTDVTAFANVITGWSVGRDNDRKRDKTAQSGGFFFRAVMHEPGAQRVLGKRYADDGLAQGEAVLRDLARHPATARHVATKLARHFVADEPSTALIAKLTARYLDSDGDLQAVMTALINTDEAWQPELSKYRTPHEYVIATMRALNYVPDKPGQLIQSLEQLGQPAYRPGSPAGWPDTAADWGSADALYKRIEWASAVGSLSMSRAKPLALARAVLGPTLSVATTKAIGGAESDAQGLTLLLASPDFLRR